MEGAIGDHSLARVTSFDKQLSELCMNCLSDKVFELPLIFSGV